MGHEAVNVDLLRLAAPVNSVDGLGFKRGVEMFVDYDGVPGLNQIEPGASSASRYQEDSVLGVWILNVVYEPSPCIVRHEASKHLSAVSDGFRALVEVGEIQIRKKLIQEYDRMREDQNFVVAVLGSEMAEKLPENLVLGNVVPARGVGLQESSESPYSFKTTTLPINSELVVAQYFHSKILSPSKIDH